MKTVERLPREFGRFRQIGGALQFAVYEDAGEDEAEALAAISSAIPDLNADTLKSLGCRRIDKRRFFGDWYDAETDSVLKIGEYATSDGKKLVNPRLKDLEGIHIRSGGSPLPEAGAGGQFAYAFSWTPYGLKAGSEQVQELFTAITKFVLPPKSRAPHPGLEQPPLAGSLKIFRGRHGVVGSVSVYSPYTCDQAAHGDCRR